MAQNGLSLLIRPILDSESLQAIQRAFESLKLNVVAEVREKDRGITAPTGSTQEGIDRAGEAKETSGQTVAGAKSKKDILWGMVSGAKSDDEEVQKQTKILQMGQEVMQTGIKTVTSITQGSFDFLQMIYQQLKSASPLLQTIESLFNLAVTLFFMPLGNKLAEVMLPAVLELVDNVVSMWDAMEGMSLSEMITFMMETGVQYFAQFFNDIGDTLIEQGGLLGSIGDMLKTIGGLIENSGGILNTMVSLSTFIVSHLKEIISLIVAFYAMQYTMQLASMYANAIGQTVFGSLGAGVASVVGVGAITGATAYGVMSMYGMAEGGYVPATEGGQWRLLGEGGQGEYVIPENQINNLGGNTTNNYYITGYTSDDVIRLIRDEVSSQISQSRIRGGF